jgi:hypothetical protein
MIEAVELLPYFERGQGSLDGFPAESYAAGFRRPDNSSAVEVILPAQIIDHTVLTSARLSIWLSLDGRLVLDGDGLDNETLEAASAAGRLGEQTLASLVSASLEPEHLAAEDDPAADLAVLRSQLADTLARVDAALERLKQS